MNHHKKNPALGVAPQAGPNESSGKRLKCLRDSNELASKQVDLALFYTRVGIPVHPVCSAGKRPLTPHGFKDATTDEVQIRAWWTRWPDALVSTPTGTLTGLWVLDVDGEVGSNSLNELLALLGLKRIEDLTPCVVQTRSGGLHLYFRLCSSERPRSRASDIAPGLDTKGEGGSIIAPGNVLPDARYYRWIGASHDFADASPAPTELIYLATFNARERGLIADNARLSHTIMAAKPGDWCAILDAHRQGERAAIIARLAASPPDADAMRRQALADLADAVSALAAQTDDRRNALFTATCRLAKYVAHGVLVEAEVLAALDTASSANGAAAKHGRSWIAATVRRGLAYGANDPLPPLARMFREGSA